MKIAKGQYPWFHMKPADTSSTLTEPRFASRTDPDVAWREIDQKAITRFQFKAVAQGQDGDCWQLSPIVAASAVHALDLKGIITKNPSRNTLTVRSFGNNGGAPIYTEITRKLPINTRTQQLAYATSLDYNPTIAFIEKGLAAAQGGYDSIDGGFPGIGLSRVTGYRHVTMPILGPKSADADFLTKILKTASKQKLATVLSTGATPEDSGIMGNHAYAVVRPIFWDDKTKQLMIGLKNPWGYAVPGDNAEKSIIVRKNTYSYGEFDMPVSKLADNFASLSLAGKKVQRTIDYTGLEQTSGKRTGPTPKWRVDPARASLDAVLANLQ